MFVLFRTAGNFIGVMKKFSRQAEGKGISSMFGRDTPVELQLIRYKDMLIL